MIEVSEKFERSDKVIGKTFADDRMLLDTRNNSVHILNRTAGLVWSLCDGANTIQDIVSKIIATHELLEGMDEKKVESDVVKVIESLCEHQLVRNVEI